MRARFHTCLTVLLFVLLVNVVFATPKPQPLWPDGIPGPTNEKSKTPTLTLHLPEKEKATGAAVVIMPGGGYGRVGVGCEGTPFAKLLVKRGIAGIVLDYRLPQGKHEIPGNDARRAVRTVRYNSKEWNIDPKKIGVWGFSAGGHLASTVTTVFDAGDKDAEDPIEKMSCRPDFSILFYPVISMTSITHGGSRRNLLGEKANELSDQFSGEKNVGPYTPPTFLLHCSDDRAVKVENSIRFYQQLVKHKIPAQMMIYEKGSHGPSAFKRNPSWEADFDAWLINRGLK